MRRAVCGSETQSNHTAKQSGCSGLTIHATTIHVHVAEHQNISTKSSVGNFQNYYVATLYKHYPIAKFEN